MAWQQRKLRNWETEKVCKAPSSLRLIGTHCQHLPILIRIPLPKWLRISSWHSYSTFGMHECVLRCDRGRATAYVVVRTCVLAMRCESIWVCASVGVCVCVCVGMYMWAWPGVTSGPNGANGADVTSSPAKKPIQLTVAGPSWQRNNLSKLWNSWRRKWQMVKQATSVCHRKSRDGS